ncbi:IQ domain-containing protein E [Aulostomus maculatus]
MSMEASDVQTDEECEELVEDVFSFSADISDKITKRKRSSGRPPPSPKSPYLSSLNVNPRRAAVAAWRLPRASLGDTRGDTPGGLSSAHLTSLSNGHDLSQMLRSECNVTPELLKQTLTSRKHKHLHSASNGFAFGSGDYREKEDMYDEIIRLKKSLHAQKSDNQKMKAKLRRLEEDNAKREKQLEELLDPTKASEYTRSLVDKKKEGSVVLNGLKQRILKLEQQCREKENTLSKLQSELRTTNLEELKITVETYFEEIQRLRILLEAAEKSSRAESKCSQRQQKALSSTVLRLSENLKHLQQENVTLREELNTESPAGGVKGYREWSKQRLLRRLLEVEKRLEDSKRHAHGRRSSSQLDQEVQTTPTESLDATKAVTMATGAVVSVGTNTDEGDAVWDLRGRVSQLETERAELQEMLSSKNDEVRQLRSEREELEEETERWKAEQTNERDTERQHYEEELGQLRGRIQSLMEDRDKLAQVEPSCVSPTMPDDHEDAGARLEEREEKDSGGHNEEREGCEGLETEAETVRTERRRQRRREKAARVIQTHWREYRNRDIVMLQSALRGHLHRESLLRDLLKDTQNKVGEAVEGELAVVAVTMIQSALRGHLARCGRAIERSGSSVPSPLGNSLPAPVPRRARPTHTSSRTGTTLSERRDGEEGQWRVPSTQEFRMTPTSELHCTAETGGAAAGDSDDSDDIIVSPSRPLRRREVLML